MPRSSYIRQGIERALLRREQSLRQLRQYFAEGIHDNLDEKDRHGRQLSMADGLRFHIKACERILAEVLSYVPTYYLAGRPVPLTHTVLEERKYNRELRARAHADEAKKSKSRREKNS